MYNWYCKYCNGIYSTSRLCVFHEITECTKNPKFKYRLQNILDDKKEKKEKS